MVFYIVKYLKVRDPFSFHIERVTKWQTALVVKFLIYVFLFIDVFTGHCTPKVETAQSITGENQDVTGI